MIQNIASLETVGGRKFGIWLYVSFVSKFLILFRTNCHISLSLPQTLLLIFPSLTLPSSTLSLSLSLSLFFPYCCAILYPLISAFSTCYLPI